MGYLTTMIGTDHTIKLSDYKLPGRCRVKKNEKNGDREGLVLKELKWDEVDAGRVREIAQGWLQGRGLASQELDYISWPFQEGDEWGTRRFYCFDKEGNMVAFIVYTACYRDGKVVSWVPNICRRDTTSPYTYALDFMALKCCEIFRSEGVESYGLGPALLADVKPTDNECTLSRLAFQWTVDLLPPHLQPYPYTNVAEHKARYRASTAPLYCCNQGLRSRATSLLTLMTTTKILPIDTTTLTCLIHGALALVSSLALYYFLPTTTSAMPLVEALQ